MATRKLVRLIPTDYEKMFLEDPDAKIIPCDQQFTSKSQMREQIQNLFQDGVKELNFVASCECGHLEGNFYEGTVCSRCHTPVRTYFADKVKFRAWLELPPFAPSIIHPAIYRVLDKWLGKCKSVSILESLLNVDVELPQPLKGLLGQGFEYFYKNFDDIIRFFLNDYAPLKQPSARARSEGIAEYIQRYRDRVFIRHIPILNQALHLITTSGTMQYSDDTVEAILDAKAELSALIYVFNYGTVGPKFVDQRMWEIQRSIVEYSTLIAKVKLISKIGYIRKLVMGARLHCSFRGVIVPITEPHEADELHLPYLIGVVCWKLELINLMTKRMGLTIPQAVAKHNAALAKFDEDIYNLLHVLIEECKEECRKHGMGYVRGLTCLFGRNPMEVVGNQQLTTMGTTTVTRWMQTYPIQGNSKSRSNRDMRVLYDA